MHPDDFYGNRNTSDNSNALPSEIDTLDDAIAYLQRARQTMGGNAKFRIVTSEEQNNTDWYYQVDDVVLTGNNSLMAKSRPNDNVEYVLFLY
jgi:hypothetical protein